MSLQPDNHHGVRRVVLPSGKTIEIVYFADQLPDDPSARNGTAPAEDLHVCPECASHLVYPTHWQEAGDNGWDLQLRCPNCEWDAEGVWETSIVERLDEELDTGTQALLRDLKQLAYANMEDEVERFVSALWADQIHPLDF